VRLDCVRYQRYHPGVGDDETFQIPVPPPPFPHHNVVFFRGPGPEGAGDREHEDILLRRVPRDTAARFRAGAGGRSLTHAQYLTALVELHRRLREAADGGDERIAGELEALGLSSVSV
jgi:predicted esterase